MSNFQLRPYQASATEELYEALSQYHRVLFYAPVAFGKGFCLGAWVQRDLGDNKRVLILSSRTEILNQNLKYVANFGETSDFVSPKRRDLPTSRVVTAMSQTLRRRVEKTEWQQWLQTFDKVYIDECQEVVSDFIHQYLRQDCEVVGLSGSPHRYGRMKQLGHIYNAAVSSITVKELIAMGYLAKPHLYSIVSPSLDDVDYSYETGDYNQKSLAKKYETKTLYSGIVSEYIRLVNGKKAICFCVSSESAIAITKEFNDNGISAKYLLSGNFDDDTAYSGERSEIIDEFARGEFTVLVNVGCLIAGFDDSSVEVVIANYATVSLVKWRQSVGRGARTTNTKKDFWILDAGANYKRLGKYDDDYPICLWHDVGMSAGVQQLKLCDTLKKDRNGKFGCRNLVPQTCTVCPCCGKILVDKQWEQLCHLEQVLENSENDIEKWCIQRKLEGWSVPRILISLCTAQTKENMKKAFKIGYMAISGKTEAEAGKYFFVFKKQFGDKILRRKQPKSTPEQKLF